MTNPDSRRDPMARLLEIMAHLRDPQSGCPWDKEQSFRTIAPYTIEEAYEVADAIEREDWAALREETWGVQLAAGFDRNKALLAGYVAQRERIDMRLVGRAVRELEGDISA